jgi:LPXTG-site transpeptidase (sortase) family protein
VIKSRFVILPNIFTLFAILISLIAAAVTVTPVRAANLVVNNNGDTVVSGDGNCTLREAINNANTNSDTTGGDCTAGSGADTITFNANYTITLVGSQLPVVSSVITITGNGAANTIIQANAAANTATYRVFEVGLSGNLTLNGLTVRHGRCAGACPTYVTNGSGLLNRGQLTITTSTFSANASLGGVGSGILNAGSMTITDSIFSGNSAGAIYQTNATGTITRTLFSGNTFGGNGGAIRNNVSTLTLIDSTVTGNSTGNADGGGIANTASSTLTVIGSTISGNSSGNGGGGIYNGGDSTVSITNSTIGNNSAISGGGGILNAGTFTIENSTISGNSSAGNFGWASGISNSGTMNITNSTISGNIGFSNIPTVYGSSIVHSGTGIMTITNSTISDNTNNGIAGGGGIYTVSGSSSVRIRNTIISNPSEADCQGPIAVTDGGNNIELGSTCGFIAAGSLQNTDPLLGPLVNNGGPTQTRELLTGSPAIDTANPALCPSADQRGVSRPQGAVCDIGAFELYVPDTTFPTVVSDSLVSSYVSNAGPASFTVTFSENVYDPAGNTDVQDVTNPINYLLVEDGVNGTFNTTSCVGGLIADDTQAGISSVTYNSSSFTSTVNLSTALTSGSYRLFVCGTTSIVDPFQNELNDGLSDYTFSFVVEAVTDVVAPSLPRTGFAPNRITALPQQPAKLAYADLGSIWLEIPSQKIKTPIVGVPQAENKSWDVQWLGQDAGWLNGTAFPSWIGNSVITAHVTNANGLPGPFASLKELKYGDQVIVHMLGEKYIFEVRTTRLVRPETTAYAFEHLEKNAYLTLITCAGFNEQSDVYRFRRIVRAVLVSVQSE